MPLVWMYPALASCPSKLPQIYCWSRYLLFALGHGLNSCLKLWKAFVLLLWGFFYNLLHGHLMSLLVVVVGFVHCGGWCSCTEYCTCKPREPNSWVRARIQKGNMSTERNQRCSPWSQKPTYSCLFLLLKSGVLEWKCSWSNERFSVLLFEIVILLVLDLYFARAGRRLPEAF